MFSSQPLQLWSDQFIRRNHALPISRIGITLLEELIHPDPLVVLDSNKRLDLENIHFDVSVLPKVMAEFEDYTIRLQTTISTGFRAHKSYEKKRSSHFAIIPNEEKSSSWHYERSLDILNLMRIISGLPLCIRHMMAFDHSDTNSTGMKIKPLVELIFPQYGVRASKKSRAHEALVFLSDYPNFVQDMSTPWLNSRTLPIRELFSTWYGMKARSESTTMLDFVSLISKLEGYHRASIGGDLMPESEYVHWLKVSKAKIKRLVDRRVFAKAYGLLTYAWEPSLRRRLKELYGQLSKVAQGSICKRPTQFINRLVNYRNDWAHNLGSLDFSSYSPLIARDLQRTILISQLITMQELSVPHSVVDMCLQRSLRGQLSVLQAE